eukprot:4869892-Pyramimonas_sp.AAC.1
MDNIVEDGVEPQGNIVAYELKLGAVLEMPIYSRGPGNGPGVRRFLHLQTAVPTTLSSVDRTTGEVCASLANLHAHGLDELKS